MKVAYFGNGIRGSRCLDAICDAGFEVCAVVVHAGRGELGPDGVARVALDRGLPIFSPNRVNDDDSIAWLEAHRPQLFVLAGYTRIISKRLLAVAPLGAINLHGGRVPEYRGASPINWQILQGETVGGCTVLRVDEGIDTGEILAEESYPIERDMTAGEAVEQTLEIFPRLLLQVLEDARDGVLQGVPQEPATGCYYSKRYPWDGEIDWHALDDVEVHNLVRALNGPGLPPAFCHLDGRKVEVVRTRLLEEEIRGPARRIALKRGRGVVVICRNRGLLIEEVAIDGQSQPASSVLPRGGASFDRVTGNGSSVTLVGPSKSASSTGSTSSLAPRDTRHRHPSDPHRTSSAPDRAVYRHPGKPSSKGTERL